MKKDYKKILKPLYSPKAGLPMIVTVPKMDYLMVSGIGYPSEESFQLAAQTLFPVAYVAKFIVKAQQPQEDFTVMPMEVKWSLDRQTHGSMKYHWTMMIMQPQSVTDCVIREAIGTLKQKKKPLPYENRLRLQSYTENLCGQILHVGPYEEAMECTFEKLKTELALQGYQWEPDSHDVYYNDSRRTPPEKLKTLMRVRIWKKNQQPCLEDPYIL